MCGPKFCSMRITQTMRAYEDRNGEDGASDLPLVAEEGFEKPGGISLPVLNS
jgi:hypothetical protein